MPPVSEPSSSALPVPGRRPPARWAICQSRVPPAGGPRRKTVIRQGDLHQPVPTRIRLFMEKPAIASYEVSGRKARSYLCLLSRHRNRGRQGRASSVSFTNGLSFFQEPENRAISRDTWKYGPPRHLLFNIWVIILSSFFPWFFRSGSGSHEMRAEADE